MKIQITAGGIYDGEGKEIPVGTEFDLKADPTAWAGRYTVLASGKGKVPAPIPDGALKAEHHGGGKFNITQGEQVLLSGLSKEDADAFNGLSDDDKAAFVADQTKPAA